MLEKYRHILLPAVMPLAFIIVASIPVEAIGCRSRGILALAIAFTSALAALATSLVALRMRFRGRAGSDRWVVSTLILAIPVVALLALA